MALSERWKHVFHTCGTLLFFIILGIFIVIPMIKGWNRWAFLEVLRGLPGFILLGVLSLIPIGATIWIVYSQQSGLFFLPAVVLAVLGALIVGVIGLGCDGGWLPCQYGFSGPVSLLGFFLSWAGITFAVGYGHYRHR